MDAVTEYVSAIAAAGLLGKSTKTIQRWIAAGRLPARKVGRSFQISVSDLSALTGRPLIHRTQGSAGPASSSTATHGRVVEPEGLGAHPTSESTLSELLAALEEELVDTAAAAARWQVRNRILTARLEQAERALALLQQQRSKVDPGGRPARKQETSVLSRNAAS